MKENGTNGTILERTLAYQLIFSKTVFSQA